MFVRLILRLLLNLRLMRLRLRLLYTLMGALPREMIRRRGERTGWSGCRPQRKIQASVVRRSGAGSASRDGRRCHRSGRDLRGTDVGHGRRRRGPDRISRVRIMDPVGDRIDLGVHRGWPDIAGDEDLLGGGRDRAGRILGGARILATSCRLRKRRRLND